MLEELERRNYAPGTIRSYIRTVEHFARHFHRPPDQLGPEHIRQYQAAMFREWKLAQNTVSQRLGALRFFYTQVLKQPWSTAETASPKKVLHLPQVLSREEVAQLIDAAQTPVYRMLLMTLYATGARRAEVARLKISDIDSQRMIIHVRGGKGRKDRDVLLSPKLLDALREYWRGLKHKSSTWLFPGRCGRTADRPINTNVVWLPCRPACARAHAPPRPTARDRRSPPSRGTAPPPAPAPPLSVAIAPAVPPAAIPRPSPITRVATGIAPDARRTRVCAGSRHARRNCCPPATCTSSSPFPVNSPPSLFRTSA